jgi:ATP-binding cassette subfamily B protein
MLILSVPLTVVALLTLPLFVLGARAVGARRRKLTGATQRSTADITAITQETLSVSGVTLAKLFGRQRDEIACFEQENRRLSDLAVREQVIGQGFFTLVYTFLGATPVSSTWWSAT